jgi:hypothetical protein
LGIQVLLLPCLEALRLAVTQARLHGKGGLGEVQGRL